MLVAFSIYIYSFLSNSKSNTLFQLPAIEVVSKLPPVDGDQKGSPIYVLVICPTRELANQVAAVATTVTKYHHSIGVQIVTGGTKLTAEQKRIHSSPCQVKFQLVALVYGFVISSVILY